MATDDDRTHDVNQTDDAKDARLRRGRSKPTPARAMAATEASPAPVEPDVEEATFGYEGTAWVARVVGRAGGPSPAAAPLLLLGFWKADAPHGERLREALTVGRNLVDLPASRLREALGRAHEPPPPPADAPDPHKGRRRSESTRRRGRRGR